MGAALVLLLVGLGAMAAGILIGRYYVPDDRQLRRTARHSKAYMRALSHLIARDHDTVIAELREIVDENVEDVEPYFALGAMFRSRGEHERAIRVHQALAVRERDKRKLRQRAMYELGLDFRAAGMPRRATKALEEVLLEEPNHEAALRVLAALYEEQARFNEAATLWHRLGAKDRAPELALREHHLLVAAAQAALARDDAESARTLLKSAEKLAQTAHASVATAELAAARGDHTAAREHLKQALVREPALVPHLVPGLLAAEQGSAPEATRAEITERVLALLAEVEATTGPRLELALIRAQIVPAASPEAAQAQSNELVTRFPDALAARVAAARLALASDDGLQVRAALEVLAAEHGALAWTLKGRWQCAHCGHRPGPFSWRCGQCRHWNTLRIETGVEPPPLPPRDRRAAPRAAAPEALLGTRPDAALPAPTLDAGMSAEELALAGTRRSVLDRVGGWFSGAWRREPRR